MKFFLFYSLLYYNLLFLFNSFFLFHIPLIYHLQHLFFFSLSYVFSFFFYLLFSFYCFFYSIFPIYCFALFHYLYLYPPSNSHLPYFKYINIKTILFLFRLNISIFLPLVFHVIFFLFFLE